MLKRQLLVLACLLRIGAAASAQDQPKGLTPEEMAQAVRSDAVTVPSPGEFLAAIDKTGKTGWQSLYRKPIPNAFPGRPQNAMNVGGLIADGYIAVEAEDAQQVKNIGKDIISLAKALGVSQSVMSRGNSITEFAEKNEWNTLKEELEATQNEVKLALVEQQDEELVTLVTIGAWVRGLEAASSWIDSNYTPEGAKLLRQPAVVGFLRNKLSSLPEQTQGDSLVKGLGKKMKEIEARLSFQPGEVPTPAQVKELKTVAAELSAEISSKP